MEAGISWVYWRQFSRLEIVLHDMIYEDDCIDSSQTDIFTLARHRSNTTVLHGQWNCETVIAPGPGHPKF